VSAREKMQELQVRHDNEMSKLHAEYLAELDKKSFDVMNGKK
jgi:hypothetical protein